MTKRDAKKKSPAPRTAKPARERRAQLSDEALDQVSGGLDTVDPSLDAKSAGKKGRRY